MSLEVLAYHVDWSGAQVALTLHGNRDQAPVHVTLSHEVAKSLAAMLSAAASMQTETQHDSK